MGKVAEYYYEMMMEDREYSEPCDTVLNSPVKKVKPVDNTEYVLYTMYNGSRMYYKKGGTVFGYQGLIPAAALRVTGKAAAEKKAAIMTRNSKNGYKWVVVKA